MIYIHSVSRNIARCVNVWLYISHAVAVSEYKQI